MEVVQQMVRYMYTAKVQHDFTRTKELLVLANKYQVSSVASHASSAADALLTKHRGLFVSQSLQEVEG